MKGDGGSPPISHLQIGAIDLYSSREIKKSGGKEDGEAQLRQ